jgi:hypothetical protein
MREKVRALLILGAVPLLAYPFVAFASIMTLAAHRDSSTSLQLVLAGGGFAIGSLLYPVVYAIFARLAWTWLTSDERRAYMLSTIPLWYLGFLLTLMWAWASLD